MSNESSPVVENEYYCRWCKKTVMRDSDKTFYQSWCGTYNRKVWLRRADTIQGMP